MSNDYYILTSNSLSKKGVTHCGSSFLQCEEFCLGLRFIFPCHSLKLQSVLSSLFALVLIQKQSIFTFCAFLCTCFAKSFYLRFFTSQQSASFSFPYFCTSLLFLFSDPLVSSPFNGDRGSMIFPLPHLIQLLSNRNSCSFHILCAYFCTALRKQQF